MKFLSLSRSAIVGGALVVSASAARTQRPFEGVLTIRMASPAGAQDATYSLKGDRMRMDMSLPDGMGMSMLIDRSARKAYVLLPQQRMYMEQDFEEPALPQGGDKGRSSFTWTGKTETVAGLRCEHGIAKDDDGSQYDVCVARGTGFFGGQSGGPMSGHGTGPSGGWQRYVADGFPLKVQKVGDPTTVFEVTRVERKSLSNELFTPPAGWQKMQMPRMGRPGPGSPNA